MGFYRFEPQDDHNRELEERVCPGSWSNPNPKEKYNLVVLGGGTAGLTAAKRAALLGAKVALVEMRSLGGSCLNFGCVPSKCIIRSARAAYDASSGNDLGISTSCVSADFPTAMRRMRRIRAQLGRDESVERLSNMGVDVFFGRARFAGPDILEVDNKLLHFKKCIIATGTRPYCPSIEGLAEAGFLTNETVFSLTELPKKIAIIGGGPIGCEMSQAFRRFGSEVYLFHKNEHILDREDADAAELIQNSFAREGIKFVLHCKTKKVEAAEDRRRIYIECEDGSSSIDVDEVLVAAGRIPNVDGINLEACGVKYNMRRGVIVDDMLRTSNENIYSAGDVASQFKFTHVSDAMAEMAVGNALLKGRKRYSSLIVPWCTYTDPEIAHVGMYEKGAVEKGIDVETIKVPLENVHRAVTDGEAHGFVRMHFKKDSGRVLGATIVARHAGEMLGEITLAIKNGCAGGNLCGVIHPHPTQAESIKKVVEERRRRMFVSRPVLGKLLQRWFRWTI